MAKITIDGKETEVTAGTTIIQAAQKLGIEVPHYCYHPGLSIAGACRMCLVEVEKMPKLQISCNTVATDGMVVHSLYQSERVKEAVTGVLEFTLINHPLDCPVCDQAGECGLQDYYMKYGLYSSRFYDAKVKKEKKAAPIGPHVMLDQERCILCSRCIRFCREVTKTDELGIFNRGDQSLVDIYPDKWLDNNYSGNVNDICPVGALTDRDFRFQCRVWYLKEVDSVCPGCSTGCNIKVHYNDNKFRRHIAEGRRVQRLKPRFNEAVNTWWMCDEGRYNYRWLDENRILEPAEREGDQRSPSEWNLVLNKIARTLTESIVQHGAGSVGILPSPQMTNEELYLVRKLFRDYLQIGNLDFRIAPSPDATWDEFLLKADKNPNTAGALALDLSPKDSRTSVQSILEAAAAGQLRILYVFHHDLGARFGDDLVYKAALNTPLMIYQGCNHNSASDAAHVVLPSASYVEKDGTFTNFAHRVQRIHKGLEPLQGALPDWKILAGLGQRLGLPFNVTCEEDIFNEMAKEVAGFQGMSYARLGSQGLELKSQ